VNEIEAVQVGDPSQVVSNGKTPQPNRPASRVVLEIRDLSVDYGLGPKALHAVIDASLMLRGGAVLGLAGESGSGKSTLVYGATRLLREPGIVVSGEVLLHSRQDGGAPIDLLKANERQLRAVRWSEISIVLQSALNALNPVVRIEKEFDDVLKAHGHRSSHRRKERAGELLEMVGIDRSRLRDHPHELSGGQRQRVMIALALALEPQVVIMDEPTTALDVVTQREILEELVALRDKLGFTLLFITHDLSLLIELADEIAVMYSGRIVERAPADELYRAPKHPYTYGLLHSFPPLHGEMPKMTGIPGSPPDLTAVPSGCPFHPRCPYAMERCTHDSPVLFRIEDSDREVACWLHVDNVPVPAELAAS
jgi:peptide/nickel transport system ATP-binding protein